MYSPTKVETRSHNIETNIETIVEQHSVRCESVRCESVISSMWINSMWFTRGSFKSIWKRGGVLSHRKNSHRNRRCFHIEKWRCHSCRQLNDGPYVRFISIYQLKFFFLIHIELNHIESRRYDSYRQLAIWFTSTDSYRLC